MIDDFRSGSCPTALAADVCIIGAGPAGISLATALADTPWTVILLEGGGQRGEASSQALYEGESVGPYALDPAQCRLRALGGATRVWGGGCIPMSSAEMARRDWVPDSGWPIGWNELAPWYERAGRVCRIEPGAFDDGNFRIDPAHADRAPPLPHIHSRISRSSTIDFGHAYRDLLRTDRGVRLLLHANLLRLEATEDAGAVRSALIGSIDGRRGQVRARYFVLAAGGLENARLLLLSNDVASGGLGNDRDLVGRYFMDHPRCRIGTVRGSDATRQARRHARPRDPCPSPFYPHISLTDSAQRSHRLLHARAREFAVERDAPKGVASLRALRASLRGPRAPDEGARVEARLLDALEQDLPMTTAPVGTGSTGRLALRTMLNAGDVAGAALRKLAHRGAVETDRLEIVGYFEQAPNRDSRVSLSDRRDALGLRRIRVDWRMGELDNASIRAGSGLIGSDVAARFGGSLEPAAWLQEPTAPPPLHGTAHHLGTTRMSDSPASGVVDSQCRVHGIDNLYVAGSSVFPTGGWSFPTFTIVALALRIADQLRMRLADMSMLGL